MRSLVLFACIALSASTPVPARQGRDGGQHTIAVHVDLVVFNVTVTDGKGRHVSGLTDRDFRLTEERRVQDITLFSAADVPVSVGLIVDASGSMREKQAAVASAALAVTTVSHAEDELFVVTFNEHATLGLPPSTPFTNDTAQVRSTLLGIRPAGMTALYDALVMGIEHVKTGTRDRKVLVVLSDGGDNASRYRLDDVIQLAQRSSATIYAVAIDADPDPDRNPGVLRKIAGTTGGRAYFPSSVQDLERVWRDIASAIRTQYTLGYYSNNAVRDGTFRRVQITASRHGAPSLRVTTRAGYRAPAGISAAR